MSPVLVVVAVVVVVRAIRSRETRGATAGADPYGSGPGRASRGVSRPLASVIGALGGESSVTGLGAAFTPWSGGTSGRPSVTSAGTGRGSRASTAVASCATWRVSAVSVDAEAGASTDGTEACDV